MEYYFEIVNLTQKMKFNLEMSRESFLSVQSSKHSENVTWWLHKLDEFPLVNGKYEIQIKVVCK